MALFEKRLEQETESPEDYKRWVEDNFSDTYIHADEKGIVHMVYIPFRQIEGLVYDE
jgi:hypothetical protein